MSDKEGRIQGKVSKETEQNFYAKYHEAAAVATRKGDKLDLSDFLELVLNAGLQTIE